MKRQTQLMKADHYATHYGAPSQQQPVLPQRPSAAAWFPDPGGQSFLRWWDGTQWTGHVQAFPPVPGQSAERQQ